MKKFFRKLTETQRTWLFFIPFGVASFCYGSWLGLLGGIIGWWLGGVIIRHEKSIRNFGYKKFFRKYRTPLINLLLLIVIDVILYDFVSLSTFSAINVGWLLGMLFWRWRKGRW